MPVGEAALHIVRLKLAELEAATLILQEKHEQQLGLKKKALELYDVQTHAAAMSSFIQGAYTQAESLIKQVIEVVDGTQLGNSDTWHRDVILIASSCTDDRGPLVDELTARAMQDVFSFRHVVRANYANSLDSDRVFEHVENMDLVTKGLSAGLRELFSWPTPSAGARP
jgi:hypothetical protein